MTAYWWAKRVGDDDSAVIKAGTVLVEEIRKDPNKIERVLNERTGKTGWRVNVTMEPVRSNLSGPLDETVDGVTIYNFAAVYPAFPNPLARNPSAVESEESLIPVHTLTAQDSAKMVDTQGEDWEQGFPWSRVDKEIADGKRNREKRGQGGPKLSLMIPITGIWRAVKGWFSKD